jgi:HSP20 family protein
MLTVRTVAPSLDRVLTLNRALDRFFGEPVTGEQNAMWVPAFDVIERPDAYQVIAELPGVLPEQLELSFDRNVLTIRGTKAPSIQHTENQELRVYTAERIHGSFERSVRLPEFVDAERIEAKLEHGVLNVTVPKAQSAMPRKIAINTAAN